MTALVGLHTNAPGVTAAALHPFVGQDLNTALADRASRRSDHPQVITYGEFDRPSNVMAAGFAELGVVGGDRVSVMFDNCPELSTTLFACARVGAVAVTINSHSVADEVRYSAEHSRSRLAVTQPAHAAAIADAIHGITIVATDHDAGEAGELPSGTAAFANLGLGLGLDPPGTVDADPWRDLCVQYTSGTIARPRGVVWTHANALWDGFVNARHTGLRRVDQRPDLEAMLYGRHSYDCRGEEELGAQRWYSIPVLAEWNDRLFVRCIPTYIYASQRRTDAPRLSGTQSEARDLLIESAQRPEYQRYMELRPEDMQFVNNYHLLHGRSAYDDDRRLGAVRHLKRSWLETSIITDRPPHFRRPVGSHWASRRTVSQMRLS